MLYASLQVNQLVNSSAKVGSVQNVDTGTVLQMKMFRCPVHPGIISQNGAPTCSNYAELPFFYTFACKARAARACELDPSHDIRSSLFLKYQTDQY
jgi:hypothetical protein